MSAASRPVPPRRPPHLRIVPPVARDGVPAVPAGATAAELIATAQAEERNGRRGAAREAYEQALYRLADADEARAHASSAVRWIARTYQMDGDADAALDCLEAALAVAEAWGDEAAAGHAVNLQAIVHWQTGRLDDAERLYLLARTRALRAGDARLAAMTAQNLGVLANIRGDFEEAQRHYEASLAEYRTLGLTRDVAYGLNNLGLLHTACRQWDAAERALSESAQVCDLAGDVTTRIAVDVNLAELWVAQGEFARAQAAVARALDGAARTGDGASVGQATKLLGVCAREAGDFAGAEAHLARADELAAARQALLLQAEIARERADLARRLGKNRDVLQQLNRAHRLFSQLRARAELADVDRRLGGLEEQFVLVARRWGESIEAKDRYTQGHCQRVADLACRIAEHAGPAHGFDAQAMFWFRIGALLHDVGKLVIPPEVLNKPGKLTDEEWVLMRSHPSAGVEALADVEFPWDVRPVIESHHERWDGTGYPHRLAGERIPLTARILCVADVYDALTSVRSYKRALSHDEAMGIMRRDVGTMFDPRAFAWFEAVAPEWALRRRRAAPPRPRPPGAAAPRARPTRPPARRRTRPTATPPPHAMRPASRPTISRRCRCAGPSATPPSASSRRGARRGARCRSSSSTSTISSWSTTRSATSRGTTYCDPWPTRSAPTRRPGDYPARYAGDEFVVLLPGTRLDEARAVAERVRSAVARAGCTRRDGSQAPVLVTLSIGVAAAPNARRDARGAVRRRRRGAVRREARRAQRGERVRQPGRPPRAPARLFRGARRRAAAAPRAARGGGRRPAARARRDRRGGRGQVDAPEAARARRGDPVRLAARRPVRRGGRPAPVRAVGGRGAWRAAGRVRAGAPFARPPVARAGAARPRARWRGRRGRAHAAWPGRRSGRRRRAAPGTRYWRSSRRSSPSRRSGGRWWWCSTTCSGRTRAAGTRSSTW
jgi:putative nucleotidyltransferase with HDIG domain